MVLYIFLRFLLCRNYFDVVICFLCSSSQDWFQVGRSGEKYRRESWAGMQDWGRYTHTNSPVDEGWKKIFAAEGDRTCATTSGSDPHSYEVTKEKAQKRIRGFKGIKPRWKQVKSEFNFPPLYQSVGRVYYIDQMCALQTQNTSESDPPIYMN